MRPSNEVGVTLCAGHALQCAARPGRLFGPCDPAESWLNGFGQAILCDFVADPSRVQGYLDEMRARRQSETGTLDGGAA